MAISIIKAHLERLSLELDNLRFELICQLVLRELIPIDSFWENNLVALLWWQEFATWAMAVFCLTYHCSVGAGGSGEYFAVCTVHCRCRSIICPIPFPSRLITPHTSTATTIVNNTMFTRRDRCSGWLRDGKPVGKPVPRRSLVQLRISWLIALVVLGTKYLAATPL